MDFDEAEIVRRPAAQGGDRLQRRRQAGLLHGFAHRDAVGVLLVQPRRVEGADQRARSQESGLVALAFLLGEADHLEVEG